MEYVITQRGLEKLSDREFKQILEAPIKGEALFKERIKQIIKDEEKSGSVEYMAAYAQLALFAYMFDKKAI